jgi:hypothetical protein
MRGRMMPAIRDVARKTWEAAYDGILSAETIDTVIADWYAVDRLRDEVGGCGVLRGRGR